LPYYTLAEKKAGQRCGSFIDYVLLLKLSPKSKNEIVYKIVNKTMMQVFKHKADRLPVFLFTSLFLLDLSVWFFVDSYLLIFLYSFSVFFPRTFIAAWNHHHQHCHTFFQTFLNRALEVIYTFHTGVSTNVWVLHHNLGHHLNYLDQTKDESGWKRADGTQMGVWEYTFVTAITGYIRAFGVGKSYPKFQKTFIGMGFLNLIILLVMFYFKPLSTLLVFIIPMLLVYGGTCWTTYFHHAGLDTDDPLHASHNNVNKVYNLLTGNLGYHTAHHMKQALHWSQLPEYHEKIHDKIPPELIKNEFSLMSGMG
jgi:fatty acid desaturase